MGRLHMAMACMASPMSTARPLPRRSTGARKSERSTVLTSVSSGMLSTRDRKGSAQVLAKLFTRSRRPESASGKGMGSECPKNPSRIGQEETIWQLYVVVPSSRRVVSKAAKFQPRAPGRWM